MNLIQIEYFVEIARQLSFTRAAEKLHISQPALSKQIIFLEKELGVKLFDRTYKKISLTESGRVLLDECEKLQLQVEKMIRTVQKAEGNIGGEIKVGCLKTIDDHFFDEIIGEFKENFPKCDISIYKYDFKELRDNLETGKVDIIFTLSFELNLMSNILHKVILFRDGCFVISANHPLAKKDKLSFQDIGDTPFIVIDENTSAGAQFIYDKWKQQNFTPSKIIHAPNNETMLSYLKHGMGIAIFDVDMIKNNKDMFKVFEVPNSKNTFSNVAVWKKSNRNPALTNFLSLINDVRENDL